MVIRFIPIPRIAGPAPFFLLTFFREQGISKKGGVKIV